MKQCNETRERIKVWSVRKIRYPPPPPLRNRKKTRNSARVVGREEGPLNLGKGWLEKRDERGPFSFVRTYERPKMAATFVRTS